MANEIPDSIFGDEEKRGRAIRLRDALRCNLPQSRVEVLPNGVDRDRDEFFIPGYPRELLTKEESAEEDLHFLSNDEHLFFLLRITEDNYTLMGAVSIGSVPPADEIQNWVRNVLSITNNLEDQRKNHRQLKARCRQIRNDLEIAVLEKQRSIQANCDYHMELRRREIEYSRSLEDEVERRTEESVLTRSALSSSALVRESLGKRQPRDSHPDERDSRNE